MWLTCMNIEATARYYEAATHNETASHNEADSHNEAVVNNEDSSNSEAASHNAVYIMRLNDNGITQYILFILLAV